MAVLTGDNCVSGPSFIKGDGGPTDPGDDLEDFMELLDDRETPRCIINIQVSGASLMISTACLWVTSTKLLPFISNILSPANDRTYLWIRSFYDLLNLRIKTNFQNVKIQ